MDDPIEAFTSITGQSEVVARRYLGMTDNNYEQAIGLFFEAPELAGSQNDTPQQAPPQIPTSTRPQRSTTRAMEHSSGVVHIDSDADVEVDDDGSDADSDAAIAAAIARAAEVEDDAAMARRMQEELYGGGDAGGGLDADGVRAPIARTTETLVGGSGDWETDDAQQAVMQQMRLRAQARAAGGGSARSGVFNQRVTPSIWDESNDGLAQATGGASEGTSKTARLAELFRPPFDLMYKLPWDEARDEGKESGKWILVNIQDNSIFDCQSLNRDIWKDSGIRDVVKENFIFMQYSKDDPRGSQYLQYYFPQKDSEAAYPHIAIVDPRTGEQVKVWSGPPVPKPADFLMQLVEFLDRYSLDLSKKNPVARRKPEKSKSIDVDKLTEQEMLDLALQNSLANNGTAGPKADDPDDLTKSFGDAGKEKGKGAKEESSEAAESSQDSYIEAVSPFDQIASDRPHTEPEGPASQNTRIQFRHADGRVVHKFRLDDPVRRIYEWLKSDPLDGKAGFPFELKASGKDLMDCLDQTIEAAGLKNSTVMMEIIDY
ncbi:putative Serine/threonine-protein kinase svkA [Sclerotinia borealis F-4128]|uniref:Putative Serine/threonine-protein kinase svkA n=1 Tax=Sclerotinia borealis (strain F-4128) TaxID=1432307 RepID=W9CL39_SCLBF|nr:putative Serine/threonine-protein kinase svkA [Sclerotinia borealis F-4128]